MVRYKDNTTNEVIHYVWITELTDLFDTTGQMDDDYEKVEKVLGKDCDYTLKDIVEKGLYNVDINDVKEYYQGQQRSNGNMFLIDEINDVLEQQHELEIIEITDIRD